MNKSMVHKIAGCILILTLTGTTVLATDYDNHWAKADLQTWSDYGIVKGQAEGILAPNADITRAELATFINRIFTLQEPSVHRQYTDVAPDAWYTEDVLTVTSHGWMYIVGDIFLPNQPATRQEVAYTMAKAYAVQQAEGEPVVFTDDTTIDSWAKQSIQALASQGYITGRPEGNFDPQAPITRAEFVTMMARMTPNYIHTPGEYTEVVPGNVIINTTDVVLSDVLIEGNVYITDAALMSAITLDNVEVTGTVYIEAGTVTLEGTFETVEVEEKGTLTLSGGRIAELMVLGDNTDITLESGTLVQHLILSGDINLTNQGTIMTTTSYVQKPMNITEAGVIIEGTFIPVHLEDTQIIINLYDLLAQTTSSDVMEGLMICTDVEGATLQGYRNNTFQTNTFYTFQEADAQLGIIGELVEEMKKLSPEAEALIESFGVTPELIFALLTEGEEVSIRQLIEAYASYGAAFTQLTGASLPDHYTLERQLHYKEETPQTVTITLVIQ